MYQGHNWGLSEDHILFSLGHQSLLLKDHKNAASLFNDLLSMPTPNPNPTQQMCHLREFFIVHHLREKEDKQVAEITIPSFDPQKCVVNLDCSDGEESLVVQDTEKWQDLERIIVEKITDLMVLTQTSQTLFGPHTANNMKPQATVKEPVKIHLPVKNVFQTPLLLKRIHLIWKFSSSTTEATNFGSNKTPNHEKFVKSQVVESVLLSDTKVTVLELGFMPLQPGELEIVGVEFSLKAQFPQSESTDYTIRGRQFLSVKGPRLSSNKEHKTNVIYGHDRRLSFKVLDERPKLVVKFDSAPESLLNGEVHRMELALTNTSKNTSIRRVHFVNCFPGMFSFPGKKTNQNPFEFPIVQDPTLNQTNQEGMLTETSLDILPLDCPEIQPGKTVKVPLWMCGTDSASKLLIDTYFYYEYEGSKPNYRITKSTIKTQIVPSITVSASKLPSCVYDDDLSCSLVVNVSHGSHGLKNKGRHLEQINVSQIGLLSTSNLVMHSVLSNDESVVSKNEGANFCLKARKQVSSNDSVLVSSVKWTNDDLSIEFLKRGFDFVGKKKLPKLRTDLVVVSWQGRLASSQELIRGQSFVALKEAEFGGDAVDAASSGSSDSNIAIPFTQVPCKVSVKNDSKISHNFLESPIAMVPFEVKVENVASKDAWFVYKVDQLSSGCRFVGCTQAKLKVVKGEVKILRFHVCAPSPGIYNVRALKFQMVFEDRPDDDELIPLQVSFLIS